MPRAGSDGSALDFVASPTGPPQITPVRGGAAWEFSPVFAQAAPDAGYAMVERSRYKGMCCAVQVRAPAFQSIAKSRRMRREEKLWKIVKYAD